jgi:ABC-type phosphate transport system substrate-binding protein
MRVWRKVRLVPTWIILTGLMLGMLLACFRQRGAAAEDNAITLQGAGATFPAPLYERWFAEYNKLHPNVQVNYQALGSGANQGFPTKPG